MAVITRTTINSMIFADNFDFEITISGGTLSTFTDWLPVSDVSWGVAELVSENIPMGNSEFVIPKGTAPLLVEITFFDNNVLEFHRYLMDWINTDILGGDNHTVAPISTIIRTLTLKHFLPSKDGKQLVLKSEFLVFPSGGLTLPLSSMSPSALSNTVTFQVVGKPTPSLSLT